MTHVFIGFKYSHQYNEYKETAVSSHTTIRRLLHTPLQYWYIYLWRFPLLGDSWLWYRKIYQVIKLKKLMHMFLKDPPYFNYFLHGGGSPPSWALRLHNIYHFENRRTRTGTGWCATIPSEPPHLILFLGVSVQHLHKVYSNGKVGDKKQRCKAVPRIGGSGFRLLLRLPALAPASGSCSGFLQILPITLVLAE